MVNIIAAVIVGVVASFTAGFAVINNDDDAVLGTSMKSAVWFYNGTQIQTALSTWGVRIPQLASCDTIDTDADGVLSCGVDDGGAASVFPSFLSQVGDVSTTSLATYDVLYYDGADWVPTATSTWDTTLDPLDFVAADASSVDSITTLSSLSLPESQVTGLNYYTDSDIDGTETAFTDWDKDALSDWATTSTDYWETEQTARTADDLSNNTIANLSDVDGSASTWDVMYWDGDSWANTATSSWDTDTTLDASLFVEVGTTSVASITTLGSLSLPSTQVTGLSYYTDADVSAYITSSTTVPSIACADGEILEFNTTGSKWECGTDDTGGAGVWTDNGTWLTPTNDEFIDVAYVVATSTTASSTFPLLSVSTAFDFLGDYITNVSTWFNGLFDTQLATKSTDDLSEGTNKYNVSHTSEVTGATDLTIASNIVDEDNLKLDTAATDNYVLIASSTASGGMDWVATSSPLLGLSASVGGSSQWHDDAASAISFSQFVGINSSSTTNVPLTIRTENIIAREGIRIYEETESGGEFWKVYVDGGGSFNFLDDGGNVGLTLVDGGNAIFVPRLGRGNDTNTYLDFPGSDRIDFYNGTVRMFTISEGVDDQVIVNENSVDIDFRVESDTKVDALMVDGATGNVGLGSTTPYATLSVVGDAVISDLVSCDTIDTDAFGYLSCGTDDGGAGGDWATTSSDYWAQNDLTLAEISDVDGSPSTNDILYWDGDSWANTATTSWDTDTNYWTDNGTWLSPGDSEGLIVSASSTFNGVSTGAPVGFDLLVGSDSYGGLRIGRTGIYSSSYAASNLDLGGAMVFRQESAPDVGNDPGIEFAFMEGGNTIRLAIPESGADNAMALLRSGTFAGPYTSTIGNDIVSCDQWTTYDSNIDCDTGGTGADLFVQDDFELEGELFTSGTIHMDADDASQLTISAANMTGAQTWTFPDDSFALGDLMVGTGAGTFGYVAKSSIDLSDFNDNLTHYVDADVSSYLYGSTTRSDLYTAGTGLSWTGTTINAEVQTSDLYTDADVSAYITSSTTVPSIACANGEILEFNTTGDKWECGTDDEGSGASPWTDNGTWIHTTNDEWIDVPHIVATSTTATSTFAGRVHIADGTAAYPGLAFSSETDSGLYRIGSGLWGLLSEGTPVISIEGTDVKSSENASWLLHRASGASSPAFSFVSDDSTGMYNPSASTIGFAAGGSEILTVGASGATTTGGFAATSLTDCDTIDTDASGNFKCGTDDTGGAGDVTKVGTPVDNHIGVWTGDGTLEGDADFIWDGLDVGIGVASPAAHLDISGNVAGKEFVKINAEGSSGRPLTLYDNGTFVGGLDYNFSSNYFSFDVTNGSAVRQTDALIVMSETDNNNVGIGDASPASLLTVGSGDLFQVDSTGAIVNVAGVTGSWDAGGIDIPTGDTYAVNGTDVLTTDTLGSGILSSSLTSLGTLVNLIVSTVFELVNGTAPTVDSVGEMALDTTDNQLLIADSGNTARVFATAEHELYSVTVASTSVEFVSGGVLPMPLNKDGFELTQYRCYVNGGTSVVLHMSDGTNDTETITCATTATSDTDVTTNDTFTAAELPYLEFGTITGTVDYVSFTAYGHITRE